MGSLYNPASCFFSRISLDFFSFLSTWSHVECETKFFGKFLNFITNISSIKTKILFFLFSWFWFLSLNIFNCRSSKFDIMSIRTFHFNGKRNSSRICEYAALRTTLCSVDGTWPCFFFRQVELWSWHHPWKAMTNQFL